jgi:hypothetical protein
VTDGVGDTRLLIEFTRTFKALSTSTIVKELRLNVETDDNTLLTTCVLQGSPMVTAGGAGALNFAVGEKSGNERETDGVYDFCYPAVNDATHGGCHTKCMSNGVWAFWPGAHSTFYSQCVFHCKPGTGKTYGVTGAYFTDIIPGSYPTAVETP